MIVAMGWAIAIVLVVIAVPSAATVVLLQGLWRKLAIGGHVKTTATFVRLLRTHGSEVSGHAAR